MRQSCIPSVLGVALAVLAIEWAVRLSGVAAGLDVAADLRALALDRAGLQRSDHVVDGRLRDADGRVLLGDVDRPDLLAAEVRLVGDRPDEVGRANAVVLAEGDVHLGSGAILL